jgi:hypothetical protein
MTLRWRELDSKFQFRAAASILPTLPLRRPRIETPVRGRVQAAVFCAANYSMEPGAGLG